MTGLITTLKSLDREDKDSYNIIVDVSDQGNPPQVSTTVLRINVLDIDDHKPRFIREIDELPVDLMVLEEQAIGIIINNISAFDEDIGENGAIDYMFIDGNEQNLFKISRTSDNYAIITTAGRIDREKTESYLLTIKCFKYGTQHNSVPRKKYSAYDLSEIRVHIKVIDIDDHLPQFDEKDQTIGVRLNIPIDTHILTVRATDDDPDSLPIMYSIQNVTFVPQYYKKDSSKLQLNLTQLFTLNTENGELKTIKYLSNFVDGYFEITIRAINSKSNNRYKDNMIKIFVIRDKSLLKFVFAKPASDVNTIISEFTSTLKSQLKKTDLEMQVFDTQVLLKTDHSLDFSSTSSCFQLSRHGTVLPPQEMQKIMDSNEIKDLLAPSYIKYSVEQVDSCAVKRRLAAASFITSTGTWLVILAILIGIAAFVATITACCMSQKYKLQSNIRLIQPSTRVPTESPYGTVPTVIYAEPIYGSL